MATLVFNGLKATGILQILVRSRNLKTTPTQMLSHVFYKIEKENLLWWLLLAVMLHTYFCWRLTYIQRITLLSFINRTNEIVHVGSNSSLQDVY